LYPAQLEAIFSEERFGAVEASTKSGKSTGCLVWLVEQALGGPGDGATYVWVSPAYSLSVEMYRRTRRMLDGDAIISSNDSEATLTLVNGARIWYRSADRPDLLYGFDSAAAVLDEASRVSEEVFFAIRSTLSATSGPMRLIGNVSRRKDWFWRLCRAIEKGQKPGWHYARLTFEDAIAGGVIDPADIEEAKQSLPPRVFDALYRAILHDEGLSLFNTDKLRFIDTAPEGWMRCRSWDLATSEKRRADYSAGVLMSVGDDGFIIEDMQRFKAEPDALLARIADTAESDPYDTTTLIEEERGASGKILLQAIRREVEDIGGRVEGSSVTGDKSTRATPLAGAVSSGKVALVRAGWNDEFIAEMAEFPGSFDDQIDAASAAYNYLSQYERRDSVVGSFFVPGMDGPGLGDRYRW
jgi:predicted phage terminase large subunit-like protein